MRYLLYLYEGSAKSFVIGPGFLKCNVLSNNFYCKSAKSTQQILAPLPSRKKQSVRYCFSYLLETLV